MGDKQARKMAVKSSQNQKKFLEIKKQDIKSNGGSI
jgi:hypothetical protein